jgi:hypothetical protein
MVPLPATVASTSVGHSQANGINGAGHIAGSLDIVTPTGTFIGSRSYVWDGTSTASRDLTAVSAGLITNATDVNDAGFVTGNGTVTVAGVTRWRAYLYHPAFGAAALPAPTPGPDSACSVNGLNQWDRVKGLVQLAGRCTSAGRSRAVRWDVIAVPPPPSLTP